MMASFDAVCSSLEESTNTHSKRLDSLVKRCETSRIQIRTMKRLGNKGNPIILQSPSTYESFHPSSLHPNDDDADGTAVSRARDASNAIIEQHLQKSREADDGAATPSDTWLDRAGSGFDEGAACALSKRMHTIPSLSHNLAQDHMLPFMMEHSNDDVYYADVAAAAHEEEEYNGNNEERIMMMMGNGGGGGQHSAAAGSQPFLCELLHDAYGVGREASSDDVGSYFPAPEGIAELRVLSDATALYGLTACAPPNDDTTNVSGAGTVDKDDNLNEKKEYVTPTDRSQTLPKLPTMILNDTNTNIHHTSENHHHQHTPIPIQPISATTHKFNDSPPQYSTTTNTTDVNPLWGVSTNWSSSSSSIHNNSTTATATRASFSYKPDVMSEDAGHFELPTDLPLKDLANMSLQQSPLLQQQQTQQQDGNQDQVAANVSGSNDAADEDMITPTLSLSRNNMQQE